MVNILSTYKEKYIMEHLPVDYTISNSIAYCVSVANPGNVNQC